MTVNNSELLEVCRRLVAFDTVGTSSNVPCAEYFGPLWRGVELPRELIAGDCC